MAITTTEVGTSRQTNSSSAPEPSVSQLVSGIVADAGKLMEQQAELLKQELRRDFRKARETGTLLLLGGVLLSGAGLLLLFMLVHLLCWLAPDLPLWGSFGLVGAILAVGGGIVFYRGQQKMETLNPLPEQTAEALKENLQWKTNPS